MKTTTAQKLVDTYLAIDRELLAALRDIFENEESAQRRAEHKRAIATVIVSLYKALDVVIEEHPSLRPPGVDP